MSGDLISRKALLEEVNNFYMKITGSANAMAIMIMEETKKSIVRIIDEQPAIYDVDKVCKKINENKEIDNLIDADQAIKIVKSGGIKNGN